MVLVNSNPATIMTDKDMADKVYIEPLTLDVVKRIIEMEKPDGILPTLGGQTGLNLAMELDESGFLENTACACWAPTPTPSTRRRTARCSRTPWRSIGEPCIPSKVVENLADALAFAEEIGYPVIVRPAYTLGGTGGGIANLDELHEIGDNGLHLSRVTQVLIEKCISGWKEIEYEVMRDGNGNVITVCTMENIDPVGVHTGDSIVVAPTQTLSDQEYQMLRTSALNIITELGIEGGCNCAVCPEAGQLRIRRHRGEPPRVPLVGAGLQGHRLSHRQGGRQDRHRLFAGRDPQRRHRADLRLL